MEQERRVVEMKKNSLSAKTCKVCGEVIAHTRRIAREWDRIEYCSAACRRTGVTQERAAS